jgi:hypothetical protein
MAVYPVELADGSHRPAGTLLWRLNSGREEVMIRRSRRLGLMATIAGTAILMFPTLAYAGYATSGNLYRATVSVSGYGTVRVCLEATITTNGTNIVMNGGSTRVYDTSGLNCDGSWSLPTGWIGVTLDGYRDGSFCGTSGYEYTSQATWQKTYSENTCTDPAGSQAFNTVVFGRVYNGSSGYHNIPGVSGPSQND